MRTAKQLRCTSHRSEAFHLFLKFLFCSCCIAHWIGCSKQQEFDSSDDIYSRCLDTTAEALKKKHIPPERESAAKNVSERICQKLADTCHKDPSNRNCTEFFEKVGK